MTYTDIDATKLSLEHIAQFVRNKNSVKHDSETFISSSIRIVLTTECRYLHQTLTTNINYIMIILQHIQVCNCCMNCNNRIYVHVSRKLRHK